MNSDCSRTQACIRNKCIDPCVGTCGQNALCRIVNHVPVCSCPSHMAGNAFVACSLVEGINIYLSKVFKQQNKFYEFRTYRDILLALLVQNPCSPSPCGPNSQCRKTNEQAVCSCVPGYLGAPPNCRPECTISSDCRSNMACSNQKCIDPCPGTCGIKAQCKVINHNPICICQGDFTGDPFVACFIACKYPTHIFFRILYSVSSDINYSKCNIDFRCIQKILKITY